MAKGLSPLECLAPRPLGSSTKVLGVILSFAVSGFAGQAQQGLLAKPNTPDDVNVLILGMAQCYHIREKGGLCGCDDVEDLGMWRLF